MTASAARAPRDYGPIQLAAFLNISQWQLARALDLQLIPAPDPDRGRWPADVANDVLERIDGIRLNLGAIPDLGAVRAARVLTVRLGVEVTVNAVEELGRQGVLPPVGIYKGHRLYDGRALEAFTDREAVVVAAAKGRTLITAAAAKYMAIRRSDFDHLVRAGRVEATGWIEGAWFGIAPVYRAGDLDDVLADPSIDWDAVRATPRGRRSLLAQLPTAESQDVDLGSEASR